MRQMSLYVIQATIKFRCESTLKSLVFCVLNQQPFSSNFG